VAPPWASHLISDLGDWHRSPLPVADIKPFELPDDAWFEFAWLDAEGNPHPDPKADPAGNPWWDYACCRFGPDFREHTDIPRAQTKAESRFVRHKYQSVHLGSPRWVFMYSPAGPDEPRPLVLFQDGKATWHHGRVGPLVDALTRKGDIPAAHYVFVQPEKRGEDYLFSSQYVAFVVSELLPFVESKLACDGRRKAWGVSLGALASAWLALAEPGVFDTVIAQSGAFLGGREDDPHNPYEGSEWLLSRIRAGEGDRLRWSLECGTLEWLHEGHLRLVDAMKTSGLPHRSVERNMGHNWANWRQGIPDSLRWALSR
jgi:enterochelin esterase-like enzyme